MRKKLIAGILSAGLLMQAVGAVSFTDVGEEYAWANEAISALAEQNIILGVGEDAYAPEENVTKEQLAALTVRALEITGEVPETATFEDVAKERWSFEAVETAKEFFEAADGTFAPEQAANRLTVASVLMKALQKQLPELQYKESKSEFSDLSVLSAEEQELISKAAASDVVTGYPDGTFKPEKDVTRAEVAVMVYRVLKVKENASVPNVTPEATATPESTPTPTPTATVAPTTTPKPTATTEPAASKSRGDFLVVSAVSTITDDNGDSAVKVSGYLDSEEVTLIVKKGEVKDVSGIEKNGTNIQVGDVLVYMKDIKGKVVDCNIIFKAAAAVKNNKIINPYVSETKAVEKAFGYFNTAYGLVRRTQGSTLELVYDDTVALETAGQSGSYGLGKEVNIYLYDVTNRNPEVRLADMSDISVDKAVGEAAESDEGNYIFVREKDDVVTDVLILNGDFS